MSAASASPSSPPSASHSTPTTAAPTSAPTTAATISGPRARPSRDGDGGGGPGGAVAGVGSGIGVGPSVMASSGVDVTPGSGAYSFLPRSSSASNVATARFGATPRQASIISSRSSSASTEARRTVTHP